MSARALREVRCGEERHRQEAQRDAEQHEPGAAERAGQRRLERERLGERLDAEEREQPCGQRHEGGEPLRIGAAQRRQPEQAERDRKHADEEADDRVAERSPSATRLGVSTAAGIFFDRLDPGRARDPDADRVVFDPVVRDDDRARAQPAELGRAVEREGDDRVVDGDRGDRQVVALRVRDPDADLARLELDAADVELRRRAAGSCRSDRRATEPVVTKSPTTSASSRIGPSAQSRQRCRPSRAPAVAARPPSVGRRRRSPSSRARRTRTGGRGT